MSANEFDTTALAELDRLSLTGEPMVAFCVKYGTSYVEVISLFVAPDRRYRVASSACCPGAAHVADFGHAWGRCLAFIAANKLEPA